ncbi:hypothetical protein [Pleomorphovibrio marinus]|uniref:hypothetical protein n=1 Tax=Pleomorphovibrio marinus TaxID=2164132 RepID=UPI000E0B4C2E|nr:hypothetical protein [Pleomorphovibrio marinus]
MKVFLLLLFYSFELFLAALLALDMEAMLLRDMVNQVEFEIPENVLIALIEDFKYWNKFSILFTFLLLSIKCFLIALVLYSGLFFANLHQGVKLWTLFHVAVMAESILIVAGIVKIIFGAFYNFTYSEFSLFYPLSVLSLMDFKSIQSIWYYPLQLLNLFEVFYCLLLVYFFNQEVEIGKANSSKVVLGSYLFSITFWLILIMFLTLNFT